MSFTNNEGADRWELGDAIQIDLDPEEPDDDEQSANDSTENEDDSGR